MISQAGDLARRLARDAEAVCRHYLSNGRRCGHYWVAGDVMNTPGRSLYVRLHGPEFGPGAAGKWTDAATGEHGDLLDLIGRNRDLHRLGEAMDEARFFLALPRPPERIARAAPAPRRSPEAARRLFRAGRPIAGTPAEAYLRARGITGRLDWPALRYHPSVYYRESDNAPLELWPALLAAVTGLDGTITGILRTWLDPRRPAKAPLADPRRALGHLLGNGVRFGSATKPAPAQAGVLGAGEGVETVLAQRCAARVARRRGALRQPPRRTRTASGAAPSLCRPRQRRGRSLRDEAAARTRRRCRHRRPRPRPGPWRFQPRSLPSWACHHARARGASARPVRPGAFSAALIIKPPCSLLVPRRVSRRKRKPVRPCRGLSVCRPLREPRVRPSRAAICRRRRAASLAPAKAGAPP